LELGLHKQRAINPPQFFADQLRKRIFWSSFILERKTALVLGRPFSVSENEVDVELPLEISDNEDDPEKLETARIQSGIESPAPYSSLSLHRYHVFVYQIHTKIRQTIQKLKNADLCDTLEDDIAARFRELDEWKGKFLAALAQAAKSSNFSIATDIDSESCSERTPPNPSSNLRSIEKERIELLLEYHKAKRSLLQPLMTEGHGRYSIQASDFAACATSSGQICQLYRKLNRLSAIPFTLRDLHAVFVAGFSLIYCIGLQPSLHSIECASDIGACSAILHTIASQWTSAKRYRDAFETMAEIVLERARKDRSLAYLQKSPRYDMSESPIMRRAVIHHDNSQLSNQPFSERYDASASHRSFRDSQRQEREDTNPNIVHHVGHNHQFQNFEYDSSFLDTMISVDSRSGPDLSELEGLLLNEGMDWFTSLVS
jgi:hypothetical protein